MVTLQRTYVVIVHQFRPSPSQASQGGIAVRANTLQPVNTLNPAIRPGQKPQSGASACIQQKKSSRFGQMMLPLVLCSILNAAIGLADMWIAGRVSSDAQAAVALAEQVIYISVAVVTALSAAVTTLVSQALGANRRATARAYARDSLVAATIIGAAATVVGTTFPLQFYSSLGASNHIARLGAEYLFVCSFADVPFALLLVTSALLRSYGRPWQTLIMAACCTIISIGGGLILSQPQFALGLKALGLSWLFGATVGAIIGLLLLWKLLWAKDYFDQAVGVQYRVYKLVSLSVPLVCSELVYCLSTLSFFKSILESPGGAAAQSALAVCTKIEEVVAVMPLQAVSQSMTCVVGRFTGARQYSCAEYASRSMVIKSLVAMTVVGGIVSVMGKHLAHALSQDAITCGSITDILLAFPGLFAMLAIGMPTAGALEGAGRTRLAAVVWSVSALIRYLMAAILSYFGAPATVLAIVALVASRICSATAFATVLNRGVIGKHSIPELHRILLVNPRSDLPQLCLKEID
jgi:Na+-driven multidrug efflux pump